MKRLLVPILSVAIGILAFALSQRFLQGRLDALERQRQELLAGQQRVWVIVAREDLAPGTTLKREDLQQKAIPAEGVGRSNILPDDSAQILEKKLLYGLKAQEPLLWTDVDVPRRPTGGLASSISPPDLGRPPLRAVSISVSGAASVSGLVQPNDRVDVLGTFDFPSSDGSGDSESVTLTMLQDVTVLATGQRVANQRRSPRERGSRSSGYNTVTLEVTPREAELLVFAEQTRGRLTLSLRHPNDVAYEKELLNVNFEHIEQRLPDYNRERQIRIRGKRDL
jgi:pilus assembly protein CpaB